MSLRSDPNHSRQAIRSIRHRYGVDQPIARKSRSSVASAPPRQTLPPPTRTRSRWLRRVLVVFFLIFAISGGVFGYKIIAAGDKISSADRSILGQLKDLLFNDGEFLIGETEGRINVLLIAVGGEGHKGQNLADTIMVISIDPTNNHAALLSIPRDLYVKVPDENYYSKINSVHAYGESQRRDNGPELLSKTVTEITGLPIHYYIRTDFIAFKSIIDSVGGVSITIDNTFFDYWHQISFPAGTEKMNGERALAYVRARYIEGPEGGDFKRTERQQQVLLALRDKVFSVQTALDFNKANSILNSLSNNIRTDLALWEMKRFYELARQFTNDNVNNLVLTTGPKGVLVGGTEVLSGTPASILKPRTGDYSEIQSIASNMLINNTPPAVVAPSTAPKQEAERAPTPKATASPSPAPDKSQITIEIRNSTTIAGLARRTSDRLKTAGFSVEGVGNSDLRDQEKTLIINSAPASNDIINEISSTIGGSAGSLPAGESNSTADILIILGNDQE